jgi:hypothetical protein
VIEKIIDMVHCHESQFHEWLAYNTQTLDQVPKDGHARRTWLGTLLLPRLRRQADRFRSLLQTCYGKERGTKIEYAEAFEPCEYGAPLDDSAIKHLFPFFT